MESCYLEPYVDQVKGKESMGGIAVPVLSQFFSSFPP